MKDSLFFWFFGKVMELYANISLLGMSEDYSVVFPNKIRIIYRKVGKIHFVIGFSRFSIANLKYTLSR